MKDAVFDGLSRKWHNNGFGIGFRRIALATNCYFRKNVDLHPIGEYATPVGDRGHNVFAPHIEHVSIMKGHNFAGAGNVQ